MVDVTSYAVVKQSTGGPKPVAPSQDVKHKSEANPEQSADKEGER